MTTGMPFFERYIKEQLENARGVETVVYNGKQICDYDEYKKYYELNDQLLRDLFTEGFLDIWDFIPDFHVAQANQAVMSHVIKASRITSDPGQEFWLRAYLALHLYADFYELVRKEYKQLCKNLPTAQSDELPFTTIRDKYEYAVPLFEYCVNKYKYAVSHAMYLITDKKQVFIYPANSSVAEEIKSEELVQYFVNIFLLYNALFVAKLRLENSFFENVTLKMAKDSQKFADETEKIFKNHYEHPNAMSPEDFLAAYGKILKEHKPPSDKKAAPPKP